MESKLTAQWGWGMEGPNKKEKELMDTDNSVVITGSTRVGGGWKRV